MAKQLAKIRTALHRALICCACAPVAAYASPQGSTTGTYTEDPTWSLGVHIGDNTGIATQFIGQYGGAVNAGLGLWRGNYSLYVDYVRFISQGLVLRPVADRTSYNVTRGRLLPYVGGGLQIRGGGAAIRLPVGIQYTLLRDPVIVAGGLTTYIDSDISISFGAFVGARILM